MIGGAWILWKKRRHREIVESETSKTTMMEPEGYITSLTTFLSRYHPGIKLFRAYDRDKVDVWLPEDPVRRVADNAVDAAWERNR